MDFGQRDGNCPNFKKIPPASIFEFRDVSSTSDVTEIHIPELAKNRKANNFKSFVLFVVVFLTWIIYTIILAHYSDPRKLSLGQDLCGNFCGIKNDLRDKRCISKDFTQHPLLLYAVTDLTWRPLRCIKRDECVVQRGYVMVFNRCFPPLPVTHKKYKTLYAMQATYKFLELYYVKFISLAATCGFSVLVSIIFITFFRICNQRSFVAFLSLEGMVISSVTSVSWYFYFSLGGRPYLYCSIVMTICLFLFAAIVPFLVTPTRLKLIVGLYQQAATVVLKVPLLIFLPIVTVIFMFLINITMFYMLMLTIANIKQDFDDQKRVRICYYIISTVTVLWTFAFSNACQCMITAGSVASYYFTRDKSKTSKTIFCRSMWITIRYHLGTIAFASPITTFFTVIKWGAHIIRRLFVMKTTDPNAEETPPDNAPTPPPEPSMMDNLKSRFQFAATIPEVQDIRSASPDSSVMESYDSCFTQCVEENAEYYSMDAYIMIALHGKRLFVSGQRAARLHWRFMFDSIVVDSLGSLAMHGFSFMIFVAGMGLTYIIIKVLIGRFSFNYVLMLGYLVGTITYFFFSLLNVASQTILLCFCEDVLLAQRKSTEYFMSRKLEELMTSISILTKTDRPRPKRKKKKKKVAKPAAERSEAHEVTEPSTSETYT